MKITSSLFLVLALSSCGSSDSDSQNNNPVAAKPLEGAKSDPMVISSTDAKGGPYESRAQMNFGTNICHASTEQMCFIKRMDKSGDSYVITITYQNLKGNSSKYEGDKTYSFVYDGDPVVELPLANQTSSCVAMIHAELKGDGYLKLVSPGCGQGETVIATWGI